MEILLIVVAALICFGILIYCFGAFVWSITKYKTVPCITFNAFKKLYAISSDKWSFWDDDVHYYSDDGYMTIEFKHYIDVLRYRLFKNKIENNKAELTLMQNEKDFILSVQKDIDSYRKENLCEMERLINK